MKRRQRKEMRITVHGTKDEIMKTQIILKMCQDYNRLGIPFPHAIEQVMTLLDYQKGEKE